MAHVISTTSTRRAQNRARVDDEAEAEVVAAEDLVIEAVVDSAVTMAHVQSKVRARQRGPHSVAVVEEDVVDEEVCVVVAEELAVVTMTRNNNKTGSPYQ